MKKFLLLLAAAFALTASAQVKQKANFVNSVEEVSITNEKPVVNTVATPFVNRARKAPAKKVAGAEQNIEGTYLLVTTNNYGSKHTDYNNKLCIAYQVSIAADGEGGYVVAGIMSNFTGEDCPVKATFADGVLSILPDQVMSTHASYGNIVLATPEDYSVSPVVRKPITFQMDEDGNFEQTYGLGLVRGIPDYSTGNYTLTPNHSASCYLMKANARLEAFDYDDNVDASCDICVEEIPEMGGGIIYGIEGGYVAYAIDADGNVQLGQQPIAYSTNYGQGSSYGFGAGVLTEIVYVDDEEEPGWAYYTSSGTSSGLGTVDGTVKVEGKNVTMSLEPYSVFAYVKAYGGLRFAGYLADAQDKQYGPTIKFTRPNTIVAGDYVVEGDVEQLSATCPEEFQEFVRDGYKANVTLAGSKNALTFESNSAEALLNGFTIVCDAIAFDETKTISLKGKTFGVTNANKDAAGKFALNAVEEGPLSEGLYQVEDIYITYNGNTVACIKGLTINSAKVLEVLEAANALVANMEATSDNIMGLYPNAGENEEFMEIYMALSETVYDGIQGAIMQSSAAAVLASYDEWMTKIAAANADVEALVALAKKYCLIVDASIDVKAGEISVKLANNVDTYYYAAIEKSIVDMWQGAGVSTNEQILEAYMNVYEVKKGDLKKGSATIKLSALNLDKGEYVFVVAGVEPEGEDLVVTTVAKRIDFTAPVKFTATAGQAFGENEGSDKAFDGDVNTKWCKDVDASSFALISASEAVHVWGYELTTANDNEQYDRRIRGLKLYATNDAAVAADANSAEWVEIASEGPGVDMQYKKNFYTTRYYTNAEAPKTAYQYFKLQLTDGGFIQFSEFKFLYETEEIPVRYKWVAGSNDNSAKVTDLDVTTKWEGSLVGNWFIVEAEDGEAHEIKNYAISTHDDGSWGDRAPKHWTIEASNDMVNWETIDEVDSDPIDNVSYTTYEFNVNTTEKYRYIKMNLIEMKGTGWQQMSEFYVNATKAEAPAPAVTFDIAAEAENVTITPSDEEATYGYAVIIPELKEALGISDETELFDVLVDNFNEITSGTQTIDIIEDYLEFVGIEELEAGTPVTVVVAPCERVDRNTVVRTGDVTIYNFEYTPSTAIANIKAEKQNAVIFNLAGQLLNARQRGVNIINGKKVLVK